MVYISLAYFKHCAALIAAWIFLTLFTVAERPRDASCHRFFC